MDVSKLKVDMKVKNYKALCELDTLRKWNVISHIARKDIHLSLNRY